MNIIKLKNLFTLLTISSVIAFVMLSTATNSWASETSRSQNDDSDNQSNSATNANKEISRSLNTNRDTSDNNNQSRTEIEVTKDILTVGKAKLSVILKVAKTSGAAFIVSIEGNNPMPSSFALGVANPVVELYSGDYNVKIEYQDDGQGPVEQHDIILSDDCSGKISPGDHKTCEVEIYLWPRIVVYTHVTAEGAKASDFTIEAIGNNPFPPKFPGNEEGTIVQMKYGEYGVHFTPVDGYFADYSTTAENPCFGKIEDDGSGFAPVTPKAFCNVTIDVSKLKVIVKVNGGPTPVSSFKYNIKSNDVNVNGPLLDPKVYTGNSQGTQIPIGPGAYYTVQMLPFNNYDASKSGECDNGQAELGKINICTVTMTYNVEQDTCNTEINEQGKPVKVC